MKKNCLFFFGDSFLAHEAAKKVFEEAKTQRLSPFSVEVLDGTVNTLAELEAFSNQLQEALSTPSLFDEKKLLWVKYLNIFGDTVTSKAQGATPFIEKIQNTLLGLKTEAAELIISARSVDKRTQVFKWFNTHSEAKELSLSEDPHSLESWAQQSFKNQETAISQDALRLLLDKIPNNKALLSQEIHKLATYALSSKAKVDKAMVQDIATNAQEEDFFEAVEAFFSLDLQRALDAAKHYFFLHKEPRPLISALQSRGRLLLQLRVLGDAKLLALDTYGISKSSLDGLKARFQQDFQDFDTKSSFNLFTQNPWYLGKMAPILKSLNLKRLFQFQEEFALYFKNSLLAPHEAQDLFEAMLIRCLKPLDQTL